MIIIELQLEKQMLKVVEFSGLNIRYRNRFVCRFWLSSID